MVKPTVTTAKKTTTKGRGVDRATLIERMKTNKEFRNKVLLNTANRWAVKYGFTQDLTFKGVSDTGKSFLLAVDGVPCKSKYVLTGTAQKPYLISGRGIAMARARQ